MSEEASAAPKIGRRRKLEHWKKIAALLMLYDLFVIHASYFLALWLRYDCEYTRIPSRYLTPYMRYITLYAVLCVALFWVCRLYHSIWRFASYTEFVRTLFVSAAASLVYSTLLTLAVQRMPLSYYLWGMILQFMLIIAARVSYRFVLHERRKRVRADENLSRVMIIGAGSAGQLFLEELRRDADAVDKVVCAIDDDPNLNKRFINGVPIVGGRECILEAVKNYRINKIFLTLPSATAEQKRDILNICKETKCELKTLPGIYQIARGQVSVSAMKPVSIEDLLGREPIRTNMQEVYNAINGKVVLVTGGGGSIGSELCRQIAAHEPKQLIIFDVYENNAYEIQLELKEKYPKLNLTVLIGSVRDSRKVFDVFRTYHPQLVYHAAAHKHVPLMEDSPCESIKNNAIGTYKTAYAAMVHGCEHFVLISTDKAVNPTNIMGASKRLCEMIIQSFDAMIKAGRADELPQLFTHEQPDTWTADRLKAAAKNSRTEFVAVRFGNVLGSNGSVIPIFKKQIAAGGPVTVTHPDIIRYFMTIPEAVSLVMTAGTYAKGGEIFVLDMGSPVKIDTLARNLIRLSGYRPDVDIRIVYTGLRPGEKLYEEKLMAEEGLKKTQNDRIHIGCPIPFDVMNFLEQLRTLMDAAYANDPSIRLLVQRIVPTYHPADSPRVILRPKEEAVAASGT